MDVNTVEEIEHLKMAILINAEKSFEQLKMKVKSLPAMTFLAEVKFDKMGIDPLEGTELNFIEQINQTFSDLVVLEGASRLLQLYPNTMLKLNLGSASGFDIESADGEVVAECFAVTTAMSNRKIEKDCSKLMSKAYDRQKYIYFYSRSDSDEKLQQIMDKYPKIMFTRITEFAP